MYWALRADAVASGIKPGTSLAGGELVWQNAGANATIAQAWATLALSAPND